MSKTKLLFVMLFTVSIAFAQIPTNGLVARYDFNNNLDDSIGTDDITPSNGIMYNADRFGNANSALNVDSRAYSGYTMPVINTARKFSISFWINITDNNIPILKFLDSNNRGFTFDATRSTPTRMSRYASNIIGSTSFGGGTSTQLIHNSWEHIVITIDQDQLNNLTAVNYYINGTLNNDLSLSFTDIGSFITSAPLLISEPNSGFNGLIDDILIYDRVLNQAEIDLIKNVVNSTLSVDNFNATVNEIKLYPNPVTDILQIQSNKNIKNLEVYSLTGKQLIVKQNTKTIDVSGLSNGMYFIRVTEEEGNASTLKFLKK